MQVLAADKTDSGMACCSTPRAALKDLALWGLGTCGGQFLHATCRLPLISTAPHRGQRALRIKYRNVGVGTL